MNKIKIELTEEQTILISRALDFYSRIGIGQFKEILDHPTFENSIYRKFSPNKPIEVGDKTTRGKVVEVGKNGKWIKTKGHWGNGEEIRKWIDVENIRHSPDYSELHFFESEINKKLSSIRDELCNENLGVNGNWGIHNRQVDDSCRQAYDIHQDIRHFFWKQDEDRPQHVVSSSVHYTSTKGAYPLKIEKI